MWKVESCCCGCSLRRDSVAIVTIILPLQIVIFLGVVLTGKRKQPRMRFEARDNHNTADSDDDDDSNKFEDEVWEAAVVFMYFTGVRIYGVVKAVNLLLIAVATPWLIIAPSNVLTIYKLDDWLQFPLVLALSLLFGMFLYFFAVIYSHYRELKYNKRPEQIPPPADIPLRVV